MGKVFCNRLLEHKRNPDKDYWTEAVVFTTSNNSFAPTEIGYLENRFCTIALDAKRYEVKNGNDPAVGNITEEKESELEEFIDYAKIVMGALGNKVFEKLTETKVMNDGSSGSASDDVILHLKRKSRKSGLTIQANCEQTNEGFVVLKGSLIETIDSDSIPPGVKQKREVVQVDGNGILHEDVLFQSPSYAAAFVIGGNANGLIEWKNKSGQTLKDIENKEVL